jgi:hypothetical protein
MTHNERLHLLGGVAVAVTIALILLIGAWFGLGWAVAAGSVMAGIGVEVYQGVRKQGTPGWADAALSAAFGVVVGVGLELYWWLA